MPQQEQPPNPPPKVPIRGYTTPVVTDGFFTERVDYTAPDYRPILRGTKYSSIIGADQTVIDQFGELYFLRENREAGSYPWGIRLWATDRLAEDTYNSAVEYVSEAVNFPAFTRVYLVRRDSYEANQTLPIGSPLTAVIAIKMLDGGGDYTYATVKIDGVGEGAEAQPVIDPDGTISSIVLTKCGTGYTEPPNVTIDGDGGSAKAIAIIQPQSAVLVSQKKSELPEEFLSVGGAAYSHPLRNEYVLITRVYETLPGPWVYSEKVDDDGQIVTVKKRRNISADITVEETVIGNIWSETTKSGQDDFVAEEVNESRPIRVGATSVTHLTTTRVDDDGVQVTVVREICSQAYVETITVREQILGSVWFRITTEPITDLKAWLIVETRPLPGNAVPSATVAPDLLLEVAERTLKDASTITPGAQLIGVDVIRKTDQKAVSELVAEEIISQKQIFPHPVAATSIPIFIPEKFRGAVPTHRFANTAAGTITIPPVLAAGEFSREEEQVTDLEFRRTIEAIDTSVLPINVLEYKMTKDKQIEFVHLTLDNGLQTLAGLINELTVEAEVQVLKYDANPSNILSLRIFGEVSSLFGADTSSTSIQNIIPPEFRDLLPTYTFGHTAAGVISVPPVLDVAELKRSEQQLDEYTFRREIETLSTTHLPVSLTNYEMTEQFGGGFLQVTMTLDDGPLTIEQGLFITECIIRELHKPDPPNFPNGLYLKIKKERYNTPGDDEWPPISSRLWDEKMRVEYDETEQVVAAGSSEDAAPGGSFAWVSEVKGLDEWKSKRINTSKPAPSYDSFSNALITYEMKPFRFPGYLQNSGFGYYVRAAEAVLVLHEIRTWWVQSATTPTTGATGSGADLEFDPIVTQDVIINNLSNTGLEYARNVLHDGFSFGVISFPATTPTATEYALGTSAGTTLTNLITLYNPGSGYSVSDSLSFSGDGGSASVTVLALGLAGSIANWTPVTGSFGWAAGSFGPYAASGGSGGGTASFFVTGIDVPDYTPGTAWIGNSHVIAASVSPEREKNIWRCEVESVVMR